MVTNRATARAFCWAGVVSQYNAGNCMPGYSQSYTSLTRLTFILPDGTEYEFRDQATGGQQETSPCYGNGYNRGTVFVTADGTAATFVSDTNIYDGVGPLTTYPSGYLSLRNGLRYR